MIMNKEAARRDILVVDDDPGQRSLLRSFLTGQGFPVTTASSGSEALHVLETSQPAMLISDVRMPAMTGLELLGFVAERYPDLPVLLVTAYADIRDAVGAIRSGAVDYLEKPIDLDQLLEAVRHGMALSESGPAQVSSEGYALPEDIITQSAAMQEVLREVALVAPSDTRLLITGESGTGKEVIADIVHRWSARANGRLIKVNCAAIPEALLESELFGHEKGAFTGALTRRIGHFEEADGGTLLLDEIGEMSPALQAKLLRVTQDGRFSRIGTNTEIQVDVRIIAATNRDLEAEVESGRFREDLFYRLNVMEIHLPPLRLRVTDIPLLAQRFAAEFSKGKPRFSPGAIAGMERYPWPGNVRELRNAIERAVLLARGDVILTEHLPRRVQQESLEPETPQNETGADTVMSAMERATILRVLKEHAYNRSDTAKALGISRRTLTYRLKEYREQGYPVNQE